MADKKTGLNWFAILALVFGGVGAITFGALIVYYSNRKDPANTSKTLPIPVWTYIFLGISIVVFVIGLLAMIMGIRKKKRMIKKVVEVEDSGNDDGLLEI